MAAVDSSSSRAGSAPTSPIQRKPVPVQTSPQRSIGRDSAKPMPVVPNLEGSRMGQSPVSPVKMSFQQDNWHQPSSATIETGGGHRQWSSGTLEVEVSTTQASTLPPHRTQLEFSQPEGTVRRAVATSSQDPQDRTGMSGPVSTTTGTDNVQLNSKPEDNTAAVAALAPGPIGSNRTATDNEDNRLSRETDTSASTPSLSNPHTSTDASVVTSASSVSNSLEIGQGRKSEDASVVESILEDPSQAQLVPQLQYHHQPFVVSEQSHMKEQDFKTASTPDLSENSAGGNRHLTPTSNVRRSSMPRPQSAYSVHSDSGRASVYLSNSSIRAPSSNSTARRSPDNRQSTYAELLSVPYPQPPPAPLAIDNSELRNVVGSNASLLSSQKTLDMYRQNVKKTNDLSLQYSFAVFLISTAQEQGFDATDTPKKPMSRTAQNASAEGTGTEPHELVKEARAILQKLANAGYPFAQYYLADGYASGLFSKGKEDYNSAFPLFVLAAKHGHAESAYRTGLCYEFGWGCRKDPAKAIQFLRTAASKRHPGAMTRLGKACLSGDLGEKRYREGLKWLKLAVESADAMYNAAPYHLGCLYETGYGEDIFKDEGYAAELFSQAADLGHAEANFRMGDAYEHGKLQCPRDPALSVHFYTGAAERGHAAAMMGLCAWYMVGAEPVLEKDEEEACEWARKAAELGYVKAQYAAGYFTEMGIGCRRDILEANVWYVMAAEAGDQRAKQRLNAIRAAASGGKAMDVGPPKAQNLSKRKSGTKDENCVVM